MASILPRSPKQMPALLGSSVRDLNSAWKGNAGSQNSILSLDLLVNILRKTCCHLEFGEGLAWTSRRAFIRAIFARPKATSRRRRRRAAPSPCNGGNLENRLQRATRRIAKNKRLFLPPWIAPDFIFMSRHYYTNWTLQRECSKKSLNLFRDDIKDIYMYKP